MYDIKFTLLNEQGEKVYTNIYLNVGDYEVIRESDHSVLVIYKHFGSPYPINRFQMSNSFSYELAIIQEQTPAGEEYLSISHI